MNAYRTIIYPKYYIQVASVPFSFCAMLNINPDVLSVIIGVKVSPTMSRYKVNSLADFCTIVYARNICLLILSMTDCTLSVDSTLITIA